MASDITQGDRIRLTADTGHDGNQQQWPVAGSEGFVVLLMPRSQKCRVQVDHYDGTWVIDSANLEKIDDYQP